MMITRVWQVTILLVLIACTSCNNQTTTTAQWIVDTDNTSIEDCFFYSDLFRSVKATILETTPASVLATVEKLYVIDDNLIILDTKRILVFDKSGKFIRTIGSVGNGPGEYVSLADFTVDEKNKEIYLFDISRNRINKYKINTGEFIGSVNLQTNKNYGYTQYIQYDNGRLYTEVRSVKESKNNYLLAEFDPVTGKQNAALLNALEWNKVSHTKNLAWKGFNKSGDFSPKFSQAFTNTIFTIDDGNVQPFISLKGKNLITAEDIQPILSAEQYERFSEFVTAKKIRGLGFDYFESDHVIYCTYMEHNSIRQILISKYDKTIRIAGLFEDNILCSESCPIIPGILYADRSGLYQYVHIESLDTFMEMAQNGTLAKTIDRKKVLELTEDSNPVLLYYEFKE